jgi:hypothetical protein
MLEMGANRHKIVFQGKMNNFCRQVMAVLKNYSPQHLNLGTPSVAQKYRIFPKNSPGAPC